MKPDQVHVVAAAVSCGSEQVLHALESRRAREIVRDVSETHRSNGIHDDVTIVHAITAADVDVRGRPDADAASDPAAPDSLTELLRELHGRERTTLG